MTARVLAGIDVASSTCLDICFTSPPVSLGLRGMGGYWTTVAGTPSRCPALAAAIGEDVLSAGTDGELPFEDKQFDVVVISRGGLTGDHARDEMLVHECHRVLKTPGYLLVGTDYRKHFNVAKMFCRGKTAGTGYDERQIFDLLKPGFDVLGIRTYCRFWTQVARFWLDREGRSCGVGTSFVYWLAQQLDALIFLTKGYQALAYGRRKGWRERQPLGTRHGVSIGDAVLHGLRR